MTPPATPRRLSAVHYAVLLALVLLATARSAVGTRLDSLTVDEPWHIVAGVEYLRTNDFRLNPEHPPLVKLVAGANMPGAFTLRPKGALSDKGAERNFVEETFFFDNDFRLAQQRARAAVWALNGALLLLLGALIASIFGMPWAVGTLLFLTLEPTVGAHGPVVMTDLPVALSLTIAALAAGRLITAWEWRWVLALGLAMGLSLAAKHSALPGLAGIGGFCALAALWQWWNHRQVPGQHRALLTRAGALSVVALLAVTTLWAFYGFHFHAGADGSDDFNRAMAAKLGDLRVERWRDLLTLLDRWQILPRSYIWGLADTVRAGVEGRGQNEHLIWGTMVTGAPPWYTWPSFILAKVPLALLALAVVGMGALTRVQWTTAQRWSIAAVLTLAVAHLVALSGSLGTYAGVRHALPVVVVLGVIAGAGVELAWRARQRAVIGVVAALFVVAIAMTARIPRLWEYHNELADGTDGAWNQFGNEGLDLGQRAFEIKRFSDSAIVPTGLPTYSSYLVWRGAGQGPGPHHHAQSHLAGGHQSGGAIYRLLHLFTFGPAPGASVRLGSGRGLPRTPAGGRSWVCDHLAGDAAATADPCHGAHGPDHGIRLREGWHRVATGGRQGARGARCDPPLDGGGDRIGQCRVATGAAGGGDRGVSTAVRVS